MIIIIRALSPRGKKRKAKEKKKKGKGQKKSKAQKKKKKGNKKINKKGAMLLSFFHTCASK